MKDINSIIAEFITAKAEQAAADKKSRAAKKRADMAADEIIRKAGGQSVLETDLYTVALETVVRIVLDTDKLFHDFKDIKNLDQYGRETTRTAITAIPRAAAAEKSA